MKYDLVKLNNPSFIAGEEHVLTTVDDLNGLPYYSTGIIENGFRIGSLLDVKAIGNLFVPINTRFVERKKFKSFTAFLYIIQIFDDFIFAPNGDLEDTTIQHVKIAYTIYRCKCYLKNNSIVCAKMHDAIAPSVSLTITGKSSEVQDEIIKTIASLITTLNEHYIVANI